MKTIYLLIWIVAILSETYRNYYIIEIKKSRPNYLQSFVLRGMAAILHGILFNPHNMGDYLPVLIFQVTSFWLLFEVSLNYLRHKPLLYYGETSGWIDRAFTWMGSLNFHFYCKVLAALVCLFSIIIIYKR